MTNEHDIKRAAEMVDKAFGIPGIWETYPNIVGSFLVSDILSIDLHNVWGFIEEINVTMQDILKELKEIKSKL